MKKYCLIILTLVIYFVAAVDAEEQVNIGAILPLTGEFAPVGNDLKSGMLLALAEEQNSKIKIYFEDDHSFNRVSAVNALNKLINVNDVRVVLNSVVNTITPLASTLNRKKVPGVVVWDSNNKISTLGDYVFGMGYSTELAGSDMAHFARINLSVNKAAIVSAHDEWSEIISNAFEEAFLKSGGSVFVHERVEITEDNFRALITKFKNANIEAIYCPLFDTAFVSLIKQAKQLGFKGKILTGDGLTPHNVQVLGEYAEDIYATQVDADNKELMQKYRNHFGPDSKPDHIGFVALGYDAVKMLLDLNLESKALVKEIEAYNANGYSGETSFSKDHLSTKRENIYQVKSEKLIALNMR